MAIKTLVCTSCGNEKSLVRDFYSSSSSLYKTIRRLPMCKTCIDELYNSLVEKLKDDKLAAKRLFVMVDVYYDEDLYNSCIEKSIKEDINWLGEYMRLKANAKYKDKSSLNNIGQYEIVENIEIKDEEDMENNKNKSSNKVSNKMIKKWGSGFEYDDYIFLEERYKDMQNAYGDKNVSSNWDYQEIALNYLQIKKLREKGDEKSINAAAKLMSENSKLMKDCEMKAIQQKSSDTDYYSNLIERIEYTRPILEPSDFFKDVDRCEYYYNRFIKQPLQVSLDLEKLEVIENWEEEFDTFGDDINYE